MKTFEVVIKAFKTVIVKAETAQAAEALAARECTSFNWETDSFEADELLSPQHVEVAKRHGAVTLENWNG